MSDNQLRYGPLHIHDLAFKIGFRISRSQDPATVANLAPALAIKGCFGKDHLHDGRALGTVRGRGQRGGREL